ncbi:MAG: tRNA glutamyl-Q(34) synthetase GluQRS [Alphaproteobacteria bacterium]
MTKLKTRFAPSPTGNLHIGHAYSALMAYDWAKDNNADFILRIEDIDQTRCNQQYVDDILADMEWLGIEYGEVIKQSERFDIYNDYIEKLKDNDLLYPCFATRKEIESVPNIKQGFDGLIYPNIWRDKSDAEINQQLESGIDYSLRLKIDKAMDFVKQDYFVDTIKGNVKLQPEQCGDVVIKRKETPTSYHLSVVVDDYLQGITNIIRGEDIFYQTHIHHILQSVFGFNNPTYTHHAVINNENTNEKLSKSTLTDKDKFYTIKYIRENSVYTPEQLKQILLDLKA